MKNLIIAIVTILSLSLSACSTTIDGEKNLENDKWIEDINYLDENLRKKHPELFTFVSEKEWEKQISKLKKDVDNLSDQDIVFRIAEIVSSIQDGHTFMDALDILTPIEEGNIEVDKTTIFPMRYEYFDDGIRVVGADNEYKEILGYKLISINGVKVDEVIEKVSTLISYDNEQSRKNNVIRHMHVYEYLEYLEIVDSEEAEYTFEDNNKNEMTINMKAKKYEEVIYLPIDNKPMKTSIMPEGEKDFAWFKHFEEDDILFLKYNSCRELGYYTVEKRLIEEINNKKPNKLVIDLRYNMGGDVRQGESLVEELKNNTDLKSEDIMVISGKGTFSAAGILTWMLQTELGATVVGEGPGGNVNLFILSSLEDPSSIDLPNSKLNIVHSVLPMVYDEDFEGGAEADIEIIQNFDDYINGIDTCYELIVNMAK